MKPQALKHTSLKTMFTALREQVSFNGFEMPGLGEVCVFIIKVVLLGNNGENTQMLIKDNNVHFWVCSVFLCLGLAGISGVIALQHLRGVFKIKHSTVFNKISYFGFWIQ